MFGRDALLWHLLVVAELRRGEGLGVQWRGINWSAGTVVITHQVTVVSHKVVVKPRTKGGRPKVVHLDPATMQLLREHQKDQVRMRGQLRVVNATDWVFCEPDGSPLHPESVSKVFDRRVRRWGLPVISIHGLRHTMATAALQGRVHPKVVQERLGHSSIGVTLDLYSHAVEGMQAEAAETIADLYRDAQ